MTPSPWRDRWLVWRNGLLADARFQRWAADFPLTRPIARRRAAALFDLVAGFVYSQTLAACVRLDLFARLAAGPQTSTELSGRLGLPLDATRRLLGAARALGLAQGAGADRHALGPQGAALLGNPGLLDMIDHHQRLYADLADGAGLLRRRGGGRLADYWPYAASDAAPEVTPEAVRGYSALMAATQPAVAADVLDAYPVRRHRRLLDVGGGEGGFLAAAGARARGLELMLFDLPSVTALAPARLARAAVLDRTRIVSGDFLTEPLPRGADLISLVRILHDHDDAEVARLLGAARAALPDEGALLIAEPMSAAPAADKVADVYFAWYLLAMGRGRARTAEELFRLLRDAGFRRMRRLRTRNPSLLRAIVARP